MSITPSARNLWLGAAMAGIGCAGVGSPPAPAVPAMVGAKGVACLAMPLPFGRAAVDSVVDSAQLVASLRASNPSDGDSATIALHFGPGGTLLRAVKVAGHLDVSNLTSYARQRPRRGLWAVRLAISSAGDPVLKLQPSHYCPPRSTAAPGRLTSRDEVMRADEARRLQAAGPYRVNILVNEAGVPAQVVLAQSSGNDRMDAMALEAARTARFVPALLDGVRVPAWYEVGLP